VKIHFKVPYHVKEIVKILVEKGDYYSIASFCYAAVMKKIDEVIASYSSLASTDVDESVKKKIELLAGLDTGKIDAIRRLLESAAALLKIADEDQ
jgi:Arc/MetJ-type ribon-helix-helix transcriptional regulator